MPREAGGIEQPGVFGIAGFAGEAGCDFVALGFGGQGLRLGREVESNAVDFLIHGLCKKLGKESIQNVRGVGWLMPRQDAV